MTKDEEKLMDLFFQVTRACYDGDRSALGELKDQILAHYRASKEEAYNSGQEDAKDEWNECTPVGEWSNE